LHLESFYGMRLSIFFLIYFLETFFLGAQTLYTKSYGDSKASPIIFIHGGPSGNATLFESTTALNLSQKGYYVIVYDRRGEGRSIDTTAMFTYNEAFEDLNWIYKKYNLNSAVLLAHSFGGLVATLYTEKYPNKVKSLVLAGALFSQQETYNHILDSVRSIYTSKYDTLMLRRVKAIEMLDNKTVDYRNNCFELASENNFFIMPKPTKASNLLRSNYEKSVYFKNNIRNKKAPILFYKNESLKNIDAKPQLNKVKNSKVPIYAIYGKQDGIFSAIQLNKIKQMVGKNNFSLIDNCSHYLFVDQQEQFIDCIKKWLKQH
jgi:proline iminopeptidase